MQKLNFRILVIIGSVIISFVLLFPMVTLAQDNDDQLPTSRAPLIGPAVTMMVNGTVFEGDPIVVTESAVIVTAEFSETVKNFTLDDIEVANGMVTGTLQPESGEFQVFTFTVILLEETVTVTLPAGAAVGTAIGSGASQKATAIIQYDPSDIPPDLTVLLKHTFNPASDNSVIVTAEFSEVVEELSSEVISVTNGTLVTASVFPKNLATDKYTFIVTIDGPRADSEITILILEGGVTGATTKEKNEMGQLAFDYEGHSNFYLPVISRPIVPYVVKGGQIRLEGDRTEGLTVFAINENEDGSAQTLEFALNFSELQFTENLVPTQTLLSGDSLHTVGGDYPKITITLNADKVIKGSNLIDIAFLNGNSIANYQFIYFYIPFGDFQNEDEANFTSFQQKWNVLHNNIITTPTIGSEFIDQKNDAILLGKSKPGNIDCKKSTPSSVSIALDNLHLGTLPSNYHLYVDGTVHTQDQNPNNDGTYDAFEIVINRTVVKRYSNPKTPIDCDVNDVAIERMVTVDAKISLSPYSGSIALSLENHLRFDDFFNTYTEIDTVYIDY